MSEPLLVPAMWLVLHPLSAELRRMGLLCCASQGGRRGKTSLAFGQGCCWGNAALGSLQSPQPLSETDWKGLGTGIKNMKVVGAVRDGSAVMSTG